MEANFLLNDHDVAYLIHGQPLSLQYQTKGCWFVVINYNSGESFFRRPYFLRPNGTFESVTNVYSREITVWGIGWGIKKLFHKKLKINFFNTRTQNISTHTPDLPTMPVYQIHSPQLKVRTKPVNIRSSVQPRLLSKEININTFDDYYTYKANHPRTNTIN